MTRAFPYRRPSPDTVQPGSWHRTVGDRTELLPDALPEWDYHTTLDLRRTVRVQADRVREQIGLPADAALRLSVRWTVSGSLLRGCAVRVDIGAEEVADVDLAFELPGADLGGVLTIETLLSLASVVESRNVTARAPTRVGSVFWGDVVSVRLQGSGAMFPVVVADFATLGHRSDAAWYLEVSDDLSAQAMGSLLLIANRRNDVLTASLDTTALDPRGAVVRSALRSGVATGLVEHALATPDFDPDADHEPGTLGAVLAGLVHQLGLTQEWPSLRAMRETEPTLFAEVLQHATRLWGGGE